MARGKKPDPGRKKNALPHCTNLKVPNGKSEGAYIAGELYGCDTHRVGYAMPCMLSVTDDALPCQYCAAGIESIWRGYVPLWDRDWCLRYALIGEDYFASVDAIPHRTKVTVSRGKNPISPLIIRDEPMLTRELPNAAPWNVAVDAFAICLRLWKSKELDRWAEANPAPKKQEAPKPAAPILKSDGTPFTPWTAKAAEKYSAPAEVAGGEVFDAVKERLKNKAARLKPSANGKHE